MTVGEKIRILRLHRNWTQKYLAEAIGVSETTIRNYELNKGGIRKRHLEKLSLLFGVDKSVLSDSTIQDYHTCMQTLFAMRDDFGLKVVHIDDLPPTAKGAALYFDSTTLQDYVHAWLQKQQELLSSGEAEDTLRAWELLFPGSYVDDCHERLNTHRKRGRINVDDSKD